MKGHDLPVAQLGRPRVWLSREPGYQNVKFVTRTTVTNNSKGLGEGPGSALVALRVRIWTPPGCRFITLPAALQVGPGNERAAKGQEGLVDIVAAFISDGQAPVAV